MWRCVLCGFLALLCVAAVAPASAGVREAWSVRYDSLPSAEEHVAAVAADRFGNVVAAGYVQKATRDFLVVKYGADGAFRWAATRDGGGTDEVVAVGVDSAGNVYVAGNSGRDFLTVKYDASGVFQWEARYVGVADLQDRVAGLAVGTDGRVVVAGTETDVPAQQSWFRIVKYNTLGEEQWKTTYHRTSTGADQAVAVALDAVGNVYAAGTTDYGEDYSDIVVVRCSPSLQFQWAVFLDDPDGGPDIAYALVVDAVGNAYVTGQFSNAMTHTDAVTAKVSPAGYMVWLSTYDGPDHFIDAGKAVSFDGSGNVCVAAESLTFTTETDYATIRYDASGNQLWAERLTGGGYATDEPVAVFADRAGGCVTTGYSWRGVIPSGLYDFLTVKYDASGAERWRQYYSGPAGKDDFARAMAADRAGNIFVAGDSANATNADVVIVKYVQEGERGGAAGAPEPLLNLGSP